jgi:hypothetical protein
MKKKLPFSLVLALAGAALLSSCSTAPTAKLDAKTDAALTAMCDKLAAAKTLRVSATRRNSPGFHAGVDVSESAEGSVVVRRPDHLAAQLKTNKGARKIGFDGKQLTIVDLAAGTHSTATAAGDIDRAVSGIQSIYGVTPPVAELLVNRPKAHLLTGVKTGKHVGTESIGGVVCDHLAFEQDGLSWQLWVATGDKLPRRISFAYPNGEGGAPLTATATLSQWKLDAPVSDAELSVKAPSGSRALEMITLP